VPICLDPDPAQGQGGCEPLGHDFPRAFLPPSTYHHVRSSGCQDIGLSGNLDIGHTHFQHTERIAGSQDHPLQPFTFALAPDFGSWGAGAMQSWLSQTQTLRHWHLALAQTLTQTHTRQSQRGLTRKGESLATNLGDCLVVASGRWCCCTEVSVFRPTDGCVPVPATVEFATSR